MKWQSKHLGWCFSPNKKLEHPLFHGAVSQKGCEAWRPTHIFHIMEQMEAVILSSVDQCFPPYSSRWQTHFQKCLLLPSNTFRGKRAEIIRLQMQYKERKYADSFKIWNSFTDLVTGISLGTVVQMTWFHWKKGVWRKAQRGDKKQRGHIHLSHIPFSFFKQGLTLLYAWLEKNSGLNTWNEHHIYLELPWQKKSKFRNPVSSLMPRLRCFPAEDVIVSYTCSSSVIPK